MRIICSPCQSSTFMVFCRCPVRISKHTSCCPRLTEAPRRSHCLHQKLPVLPCHAQALRSPQVSSGLLSSLLLLVAVPRALKRGWYLQPRLLPPKSLVPAPFHASIVYRLSSEICEYSTNQSSFCLSAYGNYSHPLHFIDLSDIPSSAPLSKSERQIIELSHQPPTLI